MSVWEPEERVRVGCCGWAMSRAAYFAHFDAVEVQQTFYDPPRPQTLAGWREEAPPGFAFAVKAWQLITHPATSPTYRRLRRPLPGRPEAYGGFQLTPEVLRAWEVTREAALAVGAAVVLFQTPPSFCPCPAHADAVRRFFENIQRGPFRLAWEPRGGWDGETVRALCQELDLLHAVDPFQDPPAVGPLRYFRLHGIGGWRHRYTEEELERLRAWAAPPAWVFFNNAAMAEDARRFRDLLGR